MSPRHQGGYSVTSTVFGIIERETFTCAHCNTVHVVLPKHRPEDVGGMCRLCDALICPRCVAGPCVPFEKKLERIEASARALRSYF